MVNIGEGPLMGTINLVTWMIGKTLIRVITTLRVASLGLNYFGKVIITLNVLAVPLPLDFAGESQPRLKG
ncbi:hypothetical protein [Spirosoma validum]|uniref:Uncharacterized protein n=1 Tax=Spirosoma validum TaxID=2771355 RepID=A0A927B8S6_9BACT|nr:hypothetical protein [Spirosoma validum]MBD2757363.1 hypothetical protein [Spirosoma validum]